VLQKNKYLKEIYIGSIIQFSSLEFLKSFKFPNILKILELRNVGLLDKAAIFLFNELASYKLERIVLDYNNLTKDSCGSIASFLKTNNSLKLLSLCGNYICSEELKILSLGLKENSSLQKLILALNPLTGTKNNNYFITSEENSEGIKALCTVLEGKKCKLIALDISTNDKVWDQSLQHIGNMILKNKRLKSFRFSIPFSQLKEENVKFLFNSVIKNTTLEVFSPHSEKIPSNILKDFFDALRKKKNTTLEGLECLELLPTDIRLILKNNGRLTTLKKELRRERKRGDGVDIFFIIGGNRKPLEKYIGDRKS
jgi:hypothetical protein